MILLVLWDCLVFTIGCCSCEVSFCLALFGLVHQLQSFLSGPDLATAIHASILPHLDYCSALYIGLPLKRVWKIQLVKNDAAKLLTSTWYQDNIFV